MRTWVTLSVLSALGILVCIGQAFTFAWLSAFPENENRLETLNLKIELYLALAAILGLFLLFAMRQAWVAARRTRKF